jgi:hypothetical protein
MLIAEMKKLKAKEREQKRKAREGGPAPVFLRDQRGLFKKKPPAAAAAATVAAPSPAPSSRRPSTASVESGSSGREREPVGKRIILTFPEKTREFLFTQKRGMLTLFHRDVSWLWRERIY